MADNLMEALVAIQKDAPQIALDSTNPHFRSRYPSLAGVMERVRPVTAEHGVAVVQLPTTLEGAPALTTRLVHAASGEVIESTMLLLPAKPDPQGQGSALTYARRYMVLSMLGLVGDEDDDGNTGTEQPTRRVEADGGGSDSLSNQSDPAAVGFVSEKQRGFYDRLLKASVPASAQSTVTRYLEQTPRLVVSAAIDALKDKDTKAIDELLLEATNWESAQSNVPYDETA